MKNLTDRVRRKLLREVAKSQVRKEAQFRDDRAVVSFCFDDYPRSSVELGGRILEEHGFRATFYAALGMAGRPEFGSMSEMLAVAACGHEVGCHTYSHLDCGRVGLATLVADCSRNRQEARRLAGLDLTSFAFPFGEYSPATKSVIGRTYRTARTVEPGIQSGRIDLAGLRAVPIDMRRGFELVDHWVARLESEGGWLLLYTHEVRDEPTDYGCTATLLASVVERCTRPEIEIMTVGRATDLCITSVQ